jgi:beta-glucoside (arbutin/salicin/cellobiose) PTS system EIICB component
MSKNYAALAKQILTATGGADNITAVTHCMTRLRFVVKDDARVDSAALKSLKGVLGVVLSARSSSAIRYRRRFAKWSTCCRTTCAPRNLRENRR